MKTILVLFGAALAVSGCACAQRTDSASAVAAAETQAATSVTVAPAERREVVERLTLTGTISPFEQVTVYAKTTGYLKRLQVDIGDRVRQGDVLAELDAPELESAIAEKRAAVARAEVGIEAARAAVEQNRAELQFQEASYNRLKAIHDRDRDLLPEHDVDQARAGYGVAAGKLRSAEASVRAAEAAVATARAELRTLENLAGYTRIVAPLSGIVTERFVDPGALIQTASSSRTQAAPLVAIARVDRLRVAVDIPEPNVAYVAPAIGAVVEASSLPGEQFPARVARIGTALDPATRTMRAEIDMPNAAGRLRPGMTAKVTLELRRIPQAVTVPSSALRSVGADRTVFVVDGSVAREVRVRTGLQSADWVQVVEGLRGGESVVVASAGVLRDGAAVRVSQ